MITVQDIFSVYELDSSCVKLVRHSNKEIQIRGSFKNDIAKFEAYQSYQKPKKFGSAKYIAVFAPYHKTTALFLGLWDIVGCIKNADFTDDQMNELRQYDELPEEWYSNGSDRYILKRNKLLDDLSERLVIEWGASTLSWVQAKDKKVAEIKSEKSIGDFESFDAFTLSFAELKMLVQSPDTNITWVKALSSVNGVYLIQDMTSGKLYVGSAYGDRGIYGRWTAYAQNGHGGNKRLKKLDPNSFQFSILEIASATMTSDGVINRENKWKDKLGSRTFGLNEN